MHGVLYKHIYETITYQHIIILIIWIRYCFMYKASDSTTICKLVDPMQALHQSDYRILN